jgi:hypothetical protein
LVNGINSDDGEKSMDKKPLIVVSILAVVLLVLGSLSNVVGYQSVKSTVANDSPLFQTRTQRATNQQQNSITSQYLGKGNVWQFPMIDNRAEQLKKAIDIINNMDDNTFERFTELCIRKIKQDNTFSDTNNKIIQMLQLLRKQSKTIIFSFTNKNNQEILPTYEGVTICGSWPPGCLIKAIIFFIFFVPIIIILDYFTIWCYPLATHDNNYIYL